MGRLLPALCLVLAASLTAPALADSPQPAAAAALFRSGTELMRQGAHEQACPRLEESLRMAASGRTALALAECHEALGRLNVAWKHYRTALSLARQNRRPDKEKQIEEHIARIERRLARLTLSVTGPLAASPGLRIDLDGDPWGAGTWGVSLPVDPGPHDLHIQATGKVPRTLSLRLAEGQSLSLTLEPLETPPEPAASASALPAAPLLSAPAEPPSSPAPAVPRRPPPETSLRRPVALGLGVGALLLGVVGGALAVRATTQAAEAQNRCFPTCAAGGDALYQRSLTTRTWAAISLTTAGGAAVAGLILAWTTPSPTSSVALTLSPSGAPGLSVRGAF